MKSKVVYNKDICSTGAGERVTRKVLAYLPEQMIVEVSFEKGAQGAEHTHKHTQSTYVREGAFEFTIEGETYRVSQGDTLVFAPDELHGCICLEKGVLIDVFTPMREDFL